MQGLLGYPVFHQGRRSNVSVAPERGGQGVPGFAYRIRCRLRRGHPALARGGCPGIPDW